MRIILLVIYFSFRSVSASQKNDSCFRKSLKFCIFWNITQSEKWRIRVFSGGHKCCPAMVLNRYSTREICIIHIMLIWNKNLTSELWSAYKNAIWSNTKIGIAKRSGLERLIEYASEHTIIGNFVNLHSFTWEAMRVNLLSYLRLLDRNYKIICWVFNKNECFSV